LAALERIARCGDLPHVAAGLGFLVSRRCRDGRLDVVGAHRACAQNAGPAEDQRTPCRHVAAHRPQRQAHGFLSLAGLTTRTWAPDARESAGFNTTASSCSRPETTSTSVPKSRPTTIFFSATR